ncbi:MAG: tripartite tricarboxylate transporter substrate binding protein, partial [Rhodoferax sp.]|nr:tripartite tricarboxylate transporter substrate binding protein [Rhodoferax sp.]
AAVRAGSAVHAMQALSFHDVRRTGRARHLLILKGKIFPAERRSMKTFISVLRSAVPAALLLFSAVAAAQNYPARPLRMVVPFAPGGPNDILGRLIGQKLTETWGQPVVVENRGGSGGTVGLEAASRMPGDGYGIAMGGASNLALAPSLYAKLPYDPVKDFTPVINVAVVPYALAVNPTVPAKNIRELISLAGRKAGYLSYGSSGVGSMSSLAAEMLKSMSKTDIVHVPYKGGSAAMPDLLSGQVSMMLETIPNALAQVRGGKLRALGVTSARRSSAAPDIPTITESGLPGFDASSWTGLSAPLGTPQAIIDRLNAETQRIVNDPAYLASLKPMGTDATASTPKGFEEHMKKDIARWSEVVRRANIKVE